MTLARKDLLEHILVKTEDMVGIESPKWKATDLKALTVIVRLLSPQYQTMIRQAKTAKEAWTILEAFFVKRNMHNRIQLRKQLHELPMSKGDSVLEHMVKFDKLTMVMETIGDAIDEDEKMVILLGSLMSDCDPIVRIIENKTGVDLLEAKEMLRREYERMQDKETTEVALKANRRVNRPQQRQHQRERPRGIRRAQ